MKERYVNRAISELAKRTSFLPKGEVETLYFGGGTPSQLSLNQIERIMQAVSQQYSLLSEAEVTFEANPDDVTPDWAQQIKILGVNRVSLGVQSFNDATLQMLNRRHTAKQAIEAVETLANAGISNLSIDLIYGLPQQTEEQFSYDLQQAFSLPITHLSSYALSIEEGTILARKVAQSELKVASEQSYVNEYELLRQQAHSKGFEHYEISNFALPHYESKHNSGYWDGTPYIGIGPGAHSYDGNALRQYNKPDLKGYLNQPTFPIEMEHLSSEELFNETVFTSLRTSKGLSLQKMTERFPVSWKEELMKAAEPHIHEGLLLLNGDRLSLAPHAIIISDSLISDLMRVSE